MVREVFYVASQVNFLSSLPHVEDSGIANLVVTDLSGLLLTSIQSGDVWPSLQLPEEKKYQLPLMTLLKITNRRMISETLKRG